MCPRSQGSGEVWEQLAVALDLPQEEAGSHRRLMSWGMYQLSFRKLNQAVLADRGRGGAGSLKTGVGGASGLSRTPER